MKNNKIFIFFLLAAFITSCEENNTRRPYGDSAAPDDVKNPSYISTPGGVVIKYELPESENLLYVKAEFSTKPGQTREVRASSYIDSLIIDGFPSTDDVKVMLYAVSRTEQVSKGVQTIVQAGPPPIHNVYQTLNAAPFWGGFLLSFTNEDEKPISLKIYYQNEETKVRTLHKIYYTENKDNEIKVTGLEGVPSDFTIYVVDRWENSSEPYEFQLTPLREDYVNHLSIKNLVLPGDVVWNLYSGSFYMLFDDNYALPNYAHSPYPLAFPHSMTMDLKVSVLLSRIKIWQRLHEPDLYAHGSPRHFQVWGCEATKDPSNFSNYFLMMDMVHEKPSGGAFGSTNTSEDIAAAMAGHEFYFENPDNNPAVRYIRFTSLESWSGMECTRMSEMKFWGRIEEEF